METKQYPDMECDVVIAGCGVAGLYAALNLPTSTRVIMLSKGAVDECDSMLAQGGICVLPEGSDYDAFFEDTMHAGHYENRRESVDIMIRSSRSVINDLLAMGVDFERKADGGLDFTREGAHSRPRIAFHADITGKEITTKLLQAVRKLDNVQILEHVAMTDILTGERDGATVCTGVVAVPVDEDNSVRPADELVNAAEGVHAGEPFKIHARHTLWATGGIGGVYDHSTNYPQLTGDACYIAQEHGIKMEHLDYVQIHPTGLFSPQPGRTFLISESCRGEGAILLNAAGERFTDELQPRDVVAAAIREQMKQDGTEHEWLSFAPVERDVVTGTLPISARAAWRTVATSWTSPFPSHPRSTTLWAACGSTRTAAPRCPSSTPPARRLAMACTARTAWLLTACSSLWFGVAAPRGTCAPASRWPWSRRASPRSMAAIAL